MTARARLYEPAPAPAPGDAPESPTPTGSRNIWFSSDAPQTTPVFARASLCAGQVIDGPAVIEQLDTTTLVYPGDGARVDAAANIIIAINHSNGAEK